MEVRGYAVSSLFVTVEVKYYREQQGSGGNDRCCAQDVAKKSMQQ